MRFMLKGKRICRPLCDPKPRVLAVSRESSDFDMRIHYFQHK